MPNYHFFDENNGFWIIVLYILTRTRKTSKINDHSSIKNKWGLPANADRIQSMRCQRHRDFLLPRSILVLKDAKTSKHEKHLPQVTQHFLQVAKNHENNKLLRKNNQKS